MTLMWPIMTMAMCTRYMHICECLYGTKDGHEYGHRQEEGTGNREREQEQGLWYDYGYSQASECEYLIPMPFDSIGLQWD